MTKLFDLGVAFLIGVAASNAACAQSFSTPASSSGAEQIQGGATYAPPPVTPVVNGKPLTLGGPKPAEKITAPVQAAAVLPKPASIEAKPNKLKPDDRFVVRVTYDIVSATKRTPVFSAEGPVVIIRSSQVNRGGKSFDIEGKALNTDVPTKVSFTVEGRKFQSVLEVSPNKGVLGDNPFAKKK